VRIRIKIKRRESENGTFRTWLLQLMMSVHWVNIAVASVDLISIRPLKPRVGVVKSLQVIGCGPVALIHTCKVGIKYKKPLGLKLI
jgi:hypothetical protein